MIRVYSDENWYVYPILSYKGSSLSKGNIKHQKSILETQVTECSVSTSKLSQISCNI